MVVQDSQVARLLLAALRSGLAAIDAQGRIVALNAPAQVVLGCPAGRLESALGRDCREALAAQPAVARLLCEALDGRDRPSRAELAIEAPAGQARRTIGYTLSALRDAEGAVAGAAMSFRDLTPYERIGEQERLRGRLAALGHMAADLAHEIRNPLAGMEVLAGLLKRRLEGQPEELALLAELTQELRKLAATVTASLDFVKPVALARASLDAVELLEESLALARARVRFDGQIERAYDEQVPALCADGEQLGALVTNLIVNALEAMAAAPRPEGHRLELVLHATGARGATAGEDGGAELLIAVADTGPGVAPELRERIFYPFFTPKPHGSGVGLAHAQKVVASHGGSIVLHAGESGVGARFEVRLPLAHEDAA
jgi:nitrogen-specific signal transduction histidine kinase